MVGVNLPFSILVGIIDKNGWVVLSEVRSIKLCNSETFFLQIIQNGIHFQII